MSNTAFCPICNEYDLVSDKSINKPFFICAYCRDTFILCHDKNGITCHDCYREHVITDVKNPKKLKTTKRYSCRQGNKLVKLCEESGIDKTGCAKLLRWNVFDDVV